VEREYHVAEPIPPLRAVVFARFHHSSQRLQITQISWQNEKRVCGVVFSELTYCDQRG
jgi:hypothetical protein